MHAEDIAKFLIEAVTRFLKR